MHRSRCRSAVCLLLLTLVVTATAGAVTPTVPQLLNYQGRLTDPTGTPVADGPRQMRFIVWRDATSVSPLDIIWDSGPVTVTTEKGLFTVKLGESPQPAISPYDFLDSSRWIGFTVGADPEQTPRMRLTAVPYAWTAGSSTIALTTYNDAIGTDQVVNGSIEAIDLAPGALPAVGRAYMSGSTNSTVPVSISQVTINVPAAGYLWVQVSGQWWLNADASSASSLYAFFYMGLCEDPGSTSTCDGTWQDFNFVDPDNASSGNSTHGFTVTRMLTLGAGGPVTLYLNAYVGSGSHSLSLYPGVTATAMFFPAGLSVTSPVIAEPTSQKSEQ